MYNMIINIIPFQSFHNTIYYRIIICDTDNHFDKNLKSNE